MSPTIENIYRLAKSQPKKIILAESQDSRIQDATKIITQQNLAEIILISPDYISQNNDLYQKLSQEYFLLRQAKGMTLEESQKILLNPLFFGTMMVKLGLADGMVAGANSTTQETFRPALQIIKTKPGQNIVSSFFIIESPNKNFGSNGVFIFSDCGLNLNPNAQELAQIAIQSAHSFKQLIGDEPKIAMLSYSTNGSGSGESVDKVKQATQIVQNLEPNLIIEGEVQIDAALVPEISLKKNPKSKIKGKSNILIFPNLDSGNIGYKLVERLGLAKAFGPITQGIAKPINDLSRGCSVEDIVTTVAITSVQSQI
ncbi:MAG: phosphate acetyltransferase [Candidatus Shapirobacteria bacterium]|nr:phosphate acetyltransferase [Candidatus Shapirobacteria bacterium]